MATEPSNLQELQELIISTECPDAEDKAWSIPVQILIDQYDSSKYGDALSSGHFSLVLPTDDDTSSTTETKAISETGNEPKKKSRSRGTSTDHICEICGKQFSLKAQFVRHLKSHSKEKPYNCRVCSKLFKYAWQRDKHVRCAHEPDSAHLGGAVHTCKLCGKKLAYRSHYLEHMKSHQESKPMICSKDGCERSFKTASQLNDHIKGHNKAFSCKICDKKFSSRSALKYHVTKHAEVPQTFVCSTCSAEFASQKALGMHKRAHSAKEGPAEQPKREVKKINITALEPNKSEKNCTISCEKLGDLMWYRCDVCPHIRSRDISTVISHVCVDHTLDQVSLKVRATKYHRIVG